MGKRGKSERAQGRACEVAAVKPTAVEAAFNYHGASLAKLLNDARGRAATKNE